MSAILESMFIQISVKYMNCNVKYDGHVGFFHNHYNYIAFINPVLTWKTLILISYSILDNIHYPASFNMEIFNLKIVLYLNSFFETGS